MTGRTFHLKTLTVLIGAVGLFAGLPSAVCVAQVAAPVREAFDGRKGKPTAIPLGWNVVAGDWRIDDGLLVADSLNGESYITYGDASWQNYEIEASVTFRKVRNPSRWLSVLVRATNDGQEPWSQVPIRFDTKQRNGMEFAVRTPANGWSVRATAAATASSKLNQPRRLKVVVNGPHISGYLDGKLMLTSQFCVDRSAGCVGFGVSGCVAAFDDLAIRQLPDSPATATAETKTQHPCDVVAHRGFSAAAPENTLAAISAAIKAGASGCEFDVYGCRDGTVVLMHDKTVDRTTDGSGPVTDLSLNQLKQLDAGSWMDARFAGEPIPTLTEALKLLRSTGCQPVIEIKMEGIAKQVVEDVAALDMVDQVAIIAFSQNVVREVRELEPGITCAWLCGKSLEGDARQQADWLQSRARECKTDLLDLKFSLLSPVLIAELKRRELGVWTWTVNEAVIMKALQEWGVDSITTDRPDLLKRRRAGSYRPKPGESGQ